MKKNATGPVPDLDEFICFAVYSTGLAFNRAYKPLLEQFGITYSQYLLLVALAAGDGQTVSQLGEKLFLESSTLTPMIKRLEVVDLVSRRRDTEDERVVRVSLTDQGRNLIERASSCIPADITAAAGVSVDELAQLKDRIVNLREHLLSNQS